VSGFSFSENHEGTDFAHQDERWKLEFEHCGGGLPHEILIFVEYAHNDTVDEAYENRLLAAPKAEKHDMLLRFAESVFREETWTYFKIENSESIQPRLRRVDIDLDLPVVPYAALEPSHELANNPEITVPPGEVGDPDADPHLMSPKHLHYRYQQKI
jgi:hypothetical protein